MDGVYGEKRERDEQEREEGGGVGQLPSSSTLHVSFLLKRLTKMGF